jgi:hypothetical protein
MGENGEDGREDQPISGISIDKAIAREHGGHLNWPVPALHRSNRHERIGLPQVVTCTLYVVSGKPLAHLGNYASAFI